MAKQWSILAMCGHFVVCGLVTSPSWVSHNCQGSSQVLVIDHQHCCICPTTKGSCSLLVSKSPACSCSKVNLLHLAIQELDVSNQAVFEALQFKPQNSEDSYAMACIWSRASTTVRCLCITVYFGINLNCKYIWKST